MGRTIDQICKQALLIRENPLPFLNKEFIMRTMKPFREELPPCKEFHRHHYGTKTQYKVIRNKNKVLSNRELLNEIFNLSSTSNLDIDFLIDEPRHMFATSLISELTDTRKVSYNHFSAVGGKHS